MTEDEQFVIHSNENTERKIMVKLFALQSIGNNVGQKDTCVVSKKIVRLYAYQVIPGTTQKALLL